MIDEKMLWDKAKRASVRASRIVQFSIERNPADQSLYYLIAYLDITCNGNEGLFNFGGFASMAEAQYFLQNIHNRIEGMRSEQANYQQDIRLN